jgi:hypothetical protein
VDPAIYCPLLYAEDESEWSEDEPVGPREIRTSEVEFGDDLTDGVLAVDGARFLMNQVMDKLKGVRHSDIKSAIEKLVADWRAYLKSKLQDFVNILLFKVVGHTKEKVRVNFDGCWLEPREFTVNIRHKQRRSMAKDSTIYLRNLKEVTTEIAGTLIEIKEFIEVFNKVNIADEE